MRCQLCCFVRRPKEGKCQVPRTLEAFCLATEFLSSPDQKTDRRNLLCRLKAESSKEWKGDWSCLGTRYLGSPRTCASHSLRPFVFSEQKLWILTWRNFYFLWPRLSWFILIKIGSRGQSLNSSGNASQGRSRKQSKKRGDARP